MAATDLPPTRMDAAKADRVDHRPAPARRASWSGLVAFSDAGIAVHAPTSDQADILAAIQRLVPARGHVASGRACCRRSTRSRRPRRTRRPTSTATGPRRPVGDARRRSHPASDASTVIVLLSDGENNERPDPIAMAQEAADRGIRIVTIGIGSAAGADLDLDGFKVHTQLDEATLTADRRDDRRLVPRGRRPPTASRRSTTTSQPKLVVRTEPLEVTSLFAALGLVLLVLGGALSLAWSGRLP